eukprot:3146620-Rhodomonas_salina.1
MQRAEDMLSRTKVALSRGCTDAPALAHPKYENTLRHFALACLSACRDMSCIRRYSVACLRDMETL